MNVVVTYTMKVINFEMNIQENTKSILIARRDMETIHPSILVTSTKGQVTGHLKSPLMMLLKSLTSFILLYENLFRKKKHKRRSRSRSSDRKVRVSRHHSPECTDISSFKFRSSLMSELSKHHNFKEKILKAQNVHETYEIKDFRPVSAERDLKQSNVKCFEAPKSESSLIPLDEIALPPEPSKKLSSSVSSVSTPLSKETAIRDSNPDSTAKDPHRIDLLQTNKLLKTHQLPLPTETL